MTSRCKCRVYEQTVCVLHIYVYAQYTYIVEGSFFMREFTQPQDGACAPG